MTKVEIYKLREILQALRHNKEADTSVSETHDKFCRLQEEGVEICNKSINNMRPL